MSRFGSVFWFVLVIASGMTNFLVKQNVQGLDDQLIRVRRETLDEQRKIHDLTADWTFLNQPELLANLNNSYVHLEPVSPKQVVTSLDAIPLRPAPPSPPPQGAAPPVADAGPAPPPAIPAAGPPPARAPTAPRSPIVQASATVAATASPRAIVPSAAGAPGRPHATAAPPSSLDALFAQVAENR